jgi:hypothetical protein
MLLTAGLLAHALWELFRAVRDPDNEASHGRTVFKRAGWLISAAGYTTLGGSALGILSGGSIRSDDAAARGWSSLLLFTAPLGRWVLMAIGAGIVITGAVFFMKGWTADLDRYVIFRASLHG